MSDDPSKIRLEALMNGLAQTPQRWEYRTVIGMIPFGAEQLEETVRDLESKLIALGQEGWEIADIDWHVPAGDQDACIIILKRGTWHAGHMVASTNITQEFVIHQLDSLTQHVQRSLEDIRAQLTEISGSIGE